MSKEQRGKFWSIKAATGNPKVGELYLYGPISTTSWFGDEVTPQQFQADLDDLGQLTELHIYINSGGGDVFAGHSIHAMIKRKAQTGCRVIGHVDGLAGSIASVIAMACDELRMPSNAMLMVHEPWIVKAGNSTELRKMADDLDQIADSMLAAYREKTKLPDEEIRAIMRAETWFTAAKAVEKGFADVLEEEVRIAASLHGDLLTMAGLEFDLSRFSKRPEIITADVPRLVGEAVGPDAESKAKALAHLETLKVLIETKRHR